ncbi:MAG TPA: hypothetical protein VGA91_05820 [Candidatus Limnocylindria bacterium]
MISRFLAGAAVAWLIMAGIVVGRFADEALPASYLIRPLAVAAALAVVIGVGTIVSGRHAAVTAAGAALLLSLAKPATALVLIGVIIALELLRRRRGLPVDSRRPVLVLAAVFFGVGFLRAAPLIDLPTAGEQVVLDGPPAYLILVDGYPRMDTLAALGIDNGPFVAALEEQGFDHYPNAHSVHGYTHKTLLAMLTGEVVQDGPSDAAEKRAIRARLLVPPGFTAIDPPVGHVTLSDGVHVDAGGITDFEAHLLAQSAAGTVLPDWTWAFLVSNLRIQLDDELDLIETSDSQQVIVHLMSPHPPFLFARGGTSAAKRGCWPDCLLFDSTIENLDISADEWARRMEGQLDGLNARLLETIGRLLSAHPDAVIVLFSDHGGRYTFEEPEEWHRSFLSARTPGHPGLLSAEPRPDVIMRLLMETYFPGET